MIPPEPEWERFMLVLRFTERKLKPELGELEAVSGFRSDDHNRRAGGARHSQHTCFAALDLVPRSSVSREHLHQQLIRAWQNDGGGRFVRGLYCGTRFHVDVARHRNRATAPPELTSSRRRSRWAWA